MLKRLFIFLTFPILCLIDLILILLLLILFFPYGIITGNNIFDISNEGLIAHKFEKICEGYGSEGGCKDGK